MAGEGDGKSKVRAGAGDGRNGGRPMGSSEGRANRGIAG
jgi:hypothetical protein